MPVISLQIEVDSSGAINKIKDFSGEIEKSSSTTKASSDSMVDSLKNLAAAIGIAYAVNKVKDFVDASVTQFARFSNNMAAVGTLTDDVGGKMDIFKEGVLKVAHETGQPLDKLTKAMFDAISAGVPAGEAIQFLGTAGKLAVAGVTDISIATDGLTSLMNAYHTSAGDAAEISDKLFTAQKYGKTTVAELSAAVGKIAPIAYAAGVSMDEMLGSMTTLTLSGIKSDQAVTSLVAVMNSFLNPQQAAKEAADRLGISLSSQSLATKGLIGVVEDLSKAQGSQIDKATAVGISIEGLKSILTLTSDEGLKKFKEFTAGINHALGSSETAFGKMKEETQFGINVLAAGFEKLFVKVGQNLAPEIDKLIGKLIEALPHLEKLANTILGPVVSAMGWMIEKTGKSIEGYELLWKALTGNGMAALSEHDRLLKNVGFSLEAQTKRLAEYEDAIRNTKDGTGAHTIALQNWEAQSKRVADLLKQKDELLKGVKKSEESATAAVEEHVKKFNSFKKAQDAVNTGYQASAEELKSWKEIAEKSIAAVGTKEEQLVQQYQLASEKIKGTSKEANDARYGLELKLGFDVKQLWDEEYKSKIEMESKYKAFTSAQLVEILQNERSTVQDIIAARDELYKRDNDNFASFRQNFEVASGASKTFYDQMGEQGKAWADATKNTLSSVYVDALKGNITDAQKYLDIFTGAVITAAAAMLAEWTIAYALVSAKAWFTSGEQSTAAGVSALANAEAAGASAIAWIAAYGAMTLGVAAAIYIIYKYWEDFKKMFEGTVTTMGAVVSMLLLPPLLTIALAIKAIQEIFKFIGDKSSEWGNAITHAFQPVQDLFDAIKNAIQAIVDGIHSITNLIPGIPGVSGGGGGTDIISQIANPVVSIGQSITSSVGDALGIHFASGGIAGGGFTPLPFAAAANGAIFDRPTIGLIGEGAYNEAVVPLPDGKNIPVKISGDNGSPVTINIPVNIDGREIFNLIYNGSQLGQLKIHKNAIYNPAGA